MAGRIRFASVSVEAGIALSVVLSPDPRISLREFDPTFTPTFARIDADDYPDLLMVGDYNHSQVFLNNGNGTFRNVTDFEVIVDGNGMGSAVADYDGDGDIDWFVTSILATGDDVPSHLSTIGNRLYRNDDGVFVDAADSAGVADGGWGWGSCFIDFENDGDLDILLLHDNAANAATLFCNDTDSNNHLGIRLQGRHPNSSAVGARVVLEADGTEQLREVTLGSNFASHNPPAQVFGLGAAAMVDRLVVHWPDGEETSLASAAVDQ